MKNDDTSRQISNARSKLGNSPRPMSSFLTFSFILPRKFYKLYRSAEPHTIENSRSFFRHCFAKIFRHSFPQTRIIFTNLSATFFFFFFVIYTPAINRASELKRPLKTQVRINYCEKCVASFRQVHPTLIDQKRLNHKFIFLFLYIHAILPFSPQRWYERRLCVCVRESEKVTSITATTVYTLYIHTHYHHIATHHH